MHLVAVDNQCSGYGIYIENTKMTNQSDRESVDIKFRRTASVDNKLDIFRRLKLQRPC